MLSGRGPSRSPAPGRTGSTTGFLRAEAEAERTAPCESVKGTGKVKIESKTIGKLKPVTEAAQGTSRSLKLKLPPNVLKKALKALAGGKKTTASINVAAVDATGARLGSRSGTVRFRRKFH